jgi:hypothetical protein
MAVKSVADVIGSAVASFDARIADTKRDRALLKSAKMQKRLTQLVTPLLYILGDLANPRVDVFCGKPVVTSACSVSIALSRLSWSTL